MKDSWWMKVKPGESMTKAAESRRDEQNKPGAAKLFVKEFGKRSGKGRASRRGPL